MEMDYKITRIPVDSSNIESYGYSEEWSVLHVEFKGGAVYEYTGVPREVWAAFQAANSKGVYFQQRIRDHYATKKLEAAV